MAQSHVQSLAAGAVGTAALITFSSIGAAISYMTVPTLLLQAPRVQSLQEKPATSPGHLARQWKLMFDIGKASALPTVAVSTASFICAITKLPGTEANIIPRWMLFGATGFGVCVVPFTFVFMSGVIEELSKRAEQVEKGDYDDDSSNTSKSQSTSEFSQVQTHELIKRWNGLNKVRVCFSLLGCSCAVTAALLLA